MNIGIIGYGAYIPKYRIKAETIAKANNQDVRKITSGLLVHEKAVPAYDEDAATIAVAAAKKALIKSGLNPEKIDALYVGSESHPYAVKPTSVTVGEALGVGNDYFAADLEFACKAGTAALQICYGLVKAGMIEYGLAIGSDTAQSRPGDVLEYSAAAGGAAFLIGSDESKIIATIDATLSVASDTPDFWRRPMQKYPEHMNRFTGEPSYFKHVMLATKKMLEKVDMRPADFDYVVFHQPNGKFTLTVAKKLGFTREQVEPGLIVTKLGNSYSATSLIGLASVLDVAKPGQKILLTSYGSGAGSDSFVLTQAQEKI